MKLQIVTPRSNVIQFPRRERASEKRLKSAPLSPAPVVDSVETDDADPPQEDELDRLLRRGLSQEEQHDADRFANECACLIREGYSLADAWTLAGACDAVHELLRLEPSMSVAEAVALVGEVEDSPERGQEDAPVSFGSSSRPSRRGTRGDSAVRSTGSPHESADGRLEEPSKTSKAVPPTAAGVHCVRAVLSVDGAGFVEPSVFSRTSEPVPGGQGSTSSPVRGSVETGVLPIASRERVAVRVHAARSRGTVSSTGPPTSIASMLAGIVRLGKEARRLAKRSAKLRSDVETWLRSEKGRSP